MLRDIEEQAIMPALALLPDRMNSREAVRMLLAIMLQESGGTERQQRGGGPARGLLQFERDGGVRGVMTHPTTRDLAHAVVEARGHQFDAQDVWAALEYDDVLAMAFGRLLLWTDPCPLPRTQGLGWQMYINAWRPGKPHPDRWPLCWSRADDWISRGIDS